MRFLSDPRVPPDGFMMGEVKRYSKEIVRSARHPLGKWVVSYAELPRNLVLHPGNTSEQYPDYITGWMLVVTPATAARLVAAARTAPYLHIEARSQ